MPHHQAEFDPYTQATLDDPAGGYAVLLKGEAVRRYEREGRNFLAVGRYHDVKSVMADHAAWSNRFGPCPKDLPHENIGLNSDPPLHTEWRRIFAAQLGPAQLERLAAGIEALAGSLLDQVAEKGGGDLHDDFTVPLVVQTMARFIGIPPEHYLVYKECADESLAASFNSLQWDASRDVNERIFAILSKEVDRRRALLADAGITEPAKDHLGTILPLDILSTLIVGRWQGRAMTDQELLYAAHALFVGGAETSSSLILSTVFRLLEHPEKWAYVLANPESLRNVIEESLRFDPPALALFRKNPNDAELLGERIPAGSRLMFSMVSANRDPAVFSQPDEFLPDRSSEELRQHLSFGAGPHSCVGAALARMEARIAMKAILARLPSLQISGPVRRIGVFNYWGYNKFPVSC